MHTNFMRQAKSWIGYCAAGLLSLTLAIGCGPAATTDDAGHGHSHGTGPGQHEHGESDAAAGGHSHGEGPHGGTVADWGGGKYHVEFTVDHDQQQATVYILGDDGKTATPIAVTEMMLTIKDPSLQAELKPTPLDGETAEQCSRFVAQHEGLGVVQEYGGTISGLIDGTPYAGNFQEEAHADH